MKKEEEKMTDEKTESAKCCQFCKEDLTEDDCYGLPVFVDFSDDFMNDAEALKKYS